MDCNKANDFMMRYMDGTLTETEAGELSRHLETCPVCKEDFVLYDEIMTDFSNIEMMSAPDDFEYLVMAKIDELPMIYEKQSASIDTIVYWVWGLFSVFAGIGFILFVNSDSMMEYLSSSPQLSQYVQVLVPISEYASEFVSNFIQMGNRLTTTAAGFASSFRFISLGAFFALAVIQYVLHKKDKVEA